MKDNILITITITDLSEIKTLKEKSTHSFKKAKDILLELEDELGDKLI